jgi:Fe-S oxidoreductase
MTQTKKTAIGEVVGILSDNLARRKSVMPIRARQATAWAKGLDLPRGGERVLYTGQMYQLMPVLNALQKTMKTAPITRMAGILRLGRFLNRFINFSWFIPRGDARSREAFNRRLRNIARLVQKAGVTFGYLYEDELYTGALLYDLGGKDVFEAHARRVYAGFKSHGVKSVITVDPHSTDMLRNVYPKIIAGYDLEVKSYLEILAEASLPVRRRLSNTLAIHDSCVYARYLGVVDSPRQLLTAAGAAIAEPTQTGRLTQCCGGPVESLYPEKALAYAEQRLDQLKKTGCKEVVAMCPICLHNLEHAAAGNGLTVRDISEVLAEAYCETRRFPGQPAPNVSETVLTKL